MWTDFRVEVVTVGEEVARDLFPKPSISSLKKFSYVKILFFDKK